MRKKLIGITLCVSLLISACACVNTDTQNEGGRAKVAVTFHALAELALAIGGEKVDIHTIIPDGMEPHDFEPKARDLEFLTSAQVILFNGLGLEPWLESAIAASGNTKALLTDTSTGVNAISYNPHIWLGCSTLKIQAQNTYEAFAAADPDNAKYFLENYINFAGALDKLLDEYSVKFETLSNRDFVTGHAAFDYLCRDFGLNQMSVEDIFAEGEPSAKMLSQLVDYCRENNVRTIFAEKSASQVVSETLAREIGARVETVYTIEVPEDGKTLLERIRYNLDTIYTSLSK